ncbi:MAG TPA: MoaD/ThiS family protein [Candidatus Xenobia bacterium]|nr:MoaD/ThiS family protein [Candidatus Xenobia bacterium]
MPKVIIPTPLRQYAGKQEAIELQAATVGELLNKLVTTHADLRRHLYTDDGKLRSFVNVYLNDEDIRYLQKEQTPVKDSDVVSIVPSIAGGRESEPRMNTEYPGVGKELSKGGVSTPPKETWLTRALAPEGVQP